MVAHLAHLDEIFPTRRYLLCPAHSFAIAVDCIDRASALATTVACPSSPQGDRGHVTAWRPAIRGAGLDSNPHSTHSPPLAPPSPPLLPPLPRPHPDPSYAPCSGARFGNPGGGSARVLQRVRVRSARLSTSTAPAARVGVRRAGC